MKLQSGDIVLNRELGIRARVSRVGKKYVHLRYYGLDGSLSLGGAQRLAHHVAEGVLRKVRRGPE